MRALRALEQPVDEWDLMIIHLMKEKLNNYNRDKWEEFTGNSDVPKLQTMISFLERRAQIDVTRPAPTHSSLNKNSHAKNGFATGLVSHSSRAYFASLSNLESNQLSKFSKNQQTHRYCPACKGVHAIYTCSQFLNMSPQNRQTEVKNASLCSNCLRVGHRVAVCSDCEPGYLQTRLHAVSV